MLNKKPVAAAVGIALARMALEASAIRSIEERRALTKTYIWEHALLASSQLHRKGH